MWPCAIRAGLKLRCGGCTSSLSCSTHVFVSIASSRGCYMVGIALVHSVTPFYVKAVTPGEKPEASARADVPSAQVAEATMDISSDSSDNRWGRRYDCAARCRSDKLGGETVSRYGCQPLGFGTPGPSGASLQMGFTVHVDLVRRRGRHPAPPSECVPPTGLLNCAARCTSSFNCAARCGSEVGFAFTCAARCTSSPSGAPAE